MTEQWSLRALAGRAQTNVPLMVEFVEGFEPWEDVSQPRNMWQVFFLPLLDPCIAFTLNTFVLKEGET